MSDFDKKYDIVDEKTPPNTELKGHYKQSFAYYTLRERLPVILTQVIDNLAKDKDLIALEYGEESREELKDILGSLSKLKYELQTDKEIVPINIDAPDKLTWNIFISSLHDGSKSFFTTCWLYAECYMYRRIREAFEGTRILKDFDYFRKQKENALTSCVPSMEDVVKSIQHHESQQRENPQEFFRRLLKLNLWGNRSDLSMSAGQEIVHESDKYNAVDKLNEYIVIDQSVDIWNCLTKPDTSNNNIVNIVTDNSGYEIFTDFIVADFLIEQKIAKKIRFYVKAIPWYISDVTANDFNFTLGYLTKHSSEILNTIGKKWSQYVQNQQFELCDVEYFWTSPYEFYRMKEIDPKLYDKLGEASLTIFKGDLNYRKLLSDFNWNPTELFETCLRGFHPTNVCTLRTIKADLICGMQEGEAEILNNKDSKWMVTGEYGVIQFAAKK